MCIRDSCYTVPVYLFVLLVRPLCVFASAVAFMNGLCLIGDIRIRQNWICLLYTSISLPHYSGAQANMGKAVKSSEMRPGDIVFYANSKGTINHVGIYIGNGQIVNAASRRSGIKISTWNYRTPVRIRNILGD